MKPYLGCFKCRSIFHFSIPKGWFLRKVLFFLPIKIYFCAKCNKRRFVWLSDEDERKYERV